MSCLSSVSSLHVSSCLLSHDCLDCVSVRHCLVLNIIYDCPIGQSIIFCSYGLYLSSSFFLFPRLYSAVAYWMSTILPHMMWTECKCRMQVWNVLHAARWKYRTQKFAICTPSHKFVALYLRKACIDNRKKCPHNKVNFSPLTAEIGWRVWGTSANFNRFYVLTSLFLRFDQQHSTEGCHVHSAGWPSRWHRAAF